ncbi:hypothetical protein OC835_007987, partial [Tilletia horrida]
EEEGEAALLATRAQLAAQDPAWNVPLPVVDDDEDDEEYPYSWSTPTATDAAPGWLQPFGTDLVDGDGDIIMTDVSSEPGVAFDADGDTIMADWMPSDRWTYL